MPSLKKRFYQVKVKSLGITSLKELGQLMGQLQRQAFRKAYGKIWDLAMVEVSTEAIASLAQYYDQSLRCFTFGDFQLSPMVEEFEEILGCPLGGRKPYHFSGFYPSLARISKIVQISAQELDRQKQVENGVVGILRKCLEEKARTLAGRGEWALFIDILALLIFGGVLFPNVDGLVDLAAIDAFLAFHDRKESSVVAILADLYDTFDRRYEKSSTRICLLYSDPLRMVGFTPSPPRGETCLPARKPPFMHRERRGILGLTLSKQRRSVCQLVPSMERRKNQDSYFVRRIPKCSLDRDEGLH